MNIILVTPAKAHSHNGNWVTADRWCMLLRALGHVVQVAGDYEQQACDCLIAIHAYRSAGAIARFKHKHPNKPLIVLLAGTDIYKFQRSDPEQTLGAMQAASRLVGLHALVQHDIPPAFAAKLRVIYQSATRATIERHLAQGQLRICVVGHLREEKDSLRAALAARSLPPSSTVQIVHLGKAHDDRWANAAREEMARNARYAWHGDVARAQVQSCFATSHAMVLSSIMEGGANVVSEAVVADVPVLASKISGNVGLLGESHPGFFEARNTEALRQLLVRCETEPSFLHEIAAHARQRASLFDPERERTAWRDLLEELR